MQRAIHIAKNILIIVGLFWMAALWKDDRSHFDPPKQPAVSHSVFLG
jgi:hypothetical protein